LAISVAGSAEAGLKVLAMRTIDPPSRTTQPGLANTVNAATGGAAENGKEEGVQVQGVWEPRRGGVKRNVVAKMIKMVVEKGGVGEDVLEGLEGFMSSASAG